MAKPSNFINMVRVLTVISFVSSAALGSVYAITKEPIAKAKLAKKIAAIQQVLPSFNNDPLQTARNVDVDGGEVRLYFAQSNGEFFGMAVETFSPKGYAGLIRLMVGFLPDGTIFNTAVLEAQETPGLGDKISPQKSDFYKQFSGKNPLTYRLQVKKDGGDVDAITAATISSRAYCDALQRAHAAFRQGLAL